MKRLALCLIAIVPLACQTQQPISTSAVCLHRAPAEGQAMGRCPVCHEQSAEGSYCPRCQAVAVVKNEMVHDAQCNKDVPAGTYCPKCKAFMFNETVMIDGKEVQKGTWSASQKRFAGLPDVAWCAQCQAPYDDVSDITHKAGQCDRREISK